MGSHEPAARARAAVGRARHHRLGRRARTLAAPGEDRDRDLPQQDDHLRLLHDGPRRDRYAQGRPVPPALPGRPVLPPRTLPRAGRAARLPALAHPGQGRVRDEVRARLQGTPRGLRPARVCEPRRVAVRRCRRDGGDLGLRAHRMADRPPLRPLRNGAARRDRPAGRHRLRDALRRSPPARSLGAAPRRARADPRPAGARARARRPRRAALRAPPAGTRRVAPGIRPGPRRRGERARAAGGLQRHARAAPPRPRSAPSASRGS